MTISQHPPQVQTPATPTSGAVLTGDGGQFAPSTTVPAASVAPPGSTTQVFFNDSGVWGGSSDLTFDKTNKRLKVNGGTTTANGNLEVAVPSGANGRITQSVGGYAAYFDIFYDHSGNPVGYIKGNGSFTSFYSSLQSVVGFEHPNLTHRFSTLTSGEAGIELDISGSLVSLFKVLSSGRKSRVLYDASNYTDLATDSAGHFRIAPTGAACGFKGWGATTPRDTFPPYLPAIARVASTSGTAYFVYLGYITEAVTLEYVRFAVATAGAGSQTAELGLFSTPSAPNGAGQTLTKIVATGSVDSLTSTGAKKNSSGFAQAIPINTHLWAGYRVAMATTQPSCTGVWTDAARGMVLTTASATSFTSGSTWSGSTVADTGAWQAPYLTATAY